MVAAAAAAVFRCAVAHDGLPSGEGFLRVVVPAEVAADLPTVGASMAIQRIVSYAINKEIHNTGQAYSEVRKLVPEMATQVRAINRAANAAKHLGQRRGGRRRCRLDAEGTTCASSNIASGSETVDRKPPLSAAGSCSEEMLCEHFGECGVIVKMNEPKEEVKETVDASYYIGEVFADAAVQADLPHGSFVASIQADVAAGSAPQCGAVPVAMAEAEAEQVADAELTRLLEQFESFKLEMTRVEVYENSQQELTRLFEQYESCKLMMTLMESNMQSICDQLAVKRMCGDQSVEILPSRFSSSGLDSQPQPSYEQLVENSRSDAVNSRRESVSSQSVERQELLAGDERQLAARSAIESREIECVQPGSAWVNQYPADMTEAQRRAELDRILRDLDVLERSHEGRKQIDRMNRDLDASERSEGRRLEVRAKGRRRR